jgi:hypothetical protein
MSVSAISILYPTTGMSIHFCVIFQLFILVIHFIIFVSNHFYVYFTFVSYCIILCLAGPFVSCICFGVSIFTIYHMYLSHIVQLLIVLHILFVSVAIICHLHPHL